MNRRAFLMKSVAASVGLAAVPVVSGLSALGAAPESLNAEPEKLEDYISSEAEAVDDILSVVDAWQAELPAYDIRGALMRRLVLEKTGVQFEELDKRARA